MEYYFRKSETLNPRKRCTLDEFFNMRIIPDFEPSKFREEENESETWNPDDEDIII